MTTILTKKKDTSGAPVAGDLTNATGGAELAVNTADKRLYAKNSSNAVVEVGTNPASLNLNADLTNTSGNLTVDPATQIVEVKGDGVSVEGQVKLNCHANTHGQTIKAQPHSESVTNTMLLPKGANSTLVSEVATQTLQNKTFDDVTLGTGTADVTTMVSQVEFQNNLRERTSVNGTSATGTINFDVLSHNVELRTSDAAANFEINVRGDSSTALDATMTTGETTSIAFESSQGGTAYYLEAIQIDGSTASPVYWQGGTAPSQGNVSGVDSYLINITKTGSAAFTCLASQTQYGKVTY